MAILNMPFRYDLPNANLVNNSIFNLNRNMKKLTKAFHHAKVIEIDNNRKLYTNHGLHRNKLGKRLAIYLLAFFVQSLFARKVTSLITMDWHKELQDNGKVEYEDKIEKVPIRYSSRNKKRQMTRSNDFYGKIKCQSII
jgi:hypothetical protein